MVPVVTAVLHGLEDLKRVAKLTKQSRRNKTWDGPAS